MSKRSLPRFSAVLLATLLVAACSAYAGKPTSGNHAPVPLLRTETNNSYTYLDINNIFDMYSNNGDGSYNKYTALAGLEWPKGTGHTAIFEDGFMWAGYLSRDNKLYADGSTYFHCWQAGRITTPGGPGVPAVAVTADDPHNRIYRVRPDVNPNTPLDANLTAILQNENTLIARYDLTSSVQKIYDQYLADWNEWPADEGAPYTDVNGDGKYDPTVDIPGIPGADQTLWHVSNDMSKTLDNATYGSDPVGIELQRTIWAYNRFGPLGNALFVKNKIINKSGYELDTAYVSLWSDPDLGDAGDDFVGCDTTLSLGFVYNGNPNDATYGATPPSAGYDFFQGPIVPSPGDTAIYNFAPKPGYKNLPMSSFNFFINSNALYTDPVSNNILGTTQWYNLMRGLITSTGAPNIDPVTGKATKLAFYGDPVSKQGWVDGKISSGGKIQVITPGDRRLAMTAGPFTIAAGDTQEIVVATLVAQAADNLRSVSLLKYYDQIVQSAYNNNFDLAPPPAAPNVRVAQLSNQIVLDWGDPVTSAVTESQNFKGYKFEGYNIYQLNSNTFTESSAKRLATFDLDDGIGYINDIIYDDATGVNVVKPVQFGTNTGVIRQYITKIDGFTGLPLVNGRSYYFAVTAYNYNPNGVPKTLESAPTIYQIIPQSTAPGTRLPSNVSDVLPTRHTGPSQGFISPVVVDPTRMTGDTYRVTFDTLTSAATGKIGIVWSLTDSTLNKTYVSQRDIQTVVGFPVPAADNNYFTVDGVEVKVTTLTAQAQSALFATDTSIHPTGRWTAAGSVVDSLALEADVAGKGNAIGNCYDHWTTGSSSPQDRQRSVAIVFANTDSKGNFDPADVNVSYGYRYMFNADKRAQPGFGTFIINKAAGLPFQKFEQSVPFAAYDMESVPPRRLAVGFTENNARYGTVNGKYWPPVYVANSVAGSNSDPNGPLEWFFVLDADYSTTADPTFEVNLLQSRVPLMWMGTPARSEDNGWKGGDSLYITRSIGNGRADSYSFTTGAPTTSTSLAKIDVQSINVFPNPYFGFNKQELNKYNRFVTINHLPRRATIRVFNLAGVLLRTIKKDDPTQFATWDLKNEALLPAAAGVYVIYIDMPDLGTNKVLKLAIIPEAQFLDKY